VLSPGSGVKRVYAMFRSKNGKVSQMVFDEIILEQITFQTITTPILGNINPVRFLGLGRVDFNTIMVNWGDKRYGDPADLNNDGRVNMDDVEILMKNWNEIRVINPKKEDQKTKVIFIPTKITNTEGEDIEVTIGVSPEKDTRNYTVRFELQYPKDLLQFKSVEYAKGWIEVKDKDNYDKIDEKNGILIKTVGFPGGFKEKQILGTIKFTAKKTGTENIIFKDTSFSLNSRNTDVLSKEKITKEVAITSVEGPDNLFLQMASIFASGGKINFIAILITLLIIFLLYLLYLLWFVILKNREEEDKKETSNQKLKQA
jgi:hypothetical protein